MPDRTLGTRHNHRNAVCPALLSPRVGRLRLMKTSAKTRHAHPTAKIGMIQIQHSCGLHCENQTTETANSFSASTSRTKTGRMTSQLRTRLRNTSATAVQESADMMPSLGVR